MLKFGRLEGRNVAGRKRREDARGSVVDGMKRASRRSMVAHWLADEDVGVPGEGGA
jgi:hypothetical protein